MGRRSIFVPVLVAIVAALFPHSAESATEVPIFLQVGNRQRRAVAPPPAQRVLLAWPSSPQGDPTWIPVQNFSPTDSPLPAQRLSYASFTPATRAVIQSLLAADSDDFSATSGWEITLRGLKREAVVVSWKFVVQPQPLSTRPTTLRVVAFRPTFYVPGEGLLEVNRALSLPEVHLRAFTLRHPTDFRLTRRPATAASAGLILGRAPDTAPGAPDGLLSVPGVVVLRNNPDQRGVQVLSATLWSSFDPQGPEFRLTYRIGHQASQFVLPSEGIAQAMLALRAHQNFEAIQVGSQRYEGVRPVHLETLIVDLRVGTPTYYFLLRKQNPDRMEGDLQLVEASQVKALSRPLPMPRQLDHPVAVYSRRIDEVVADFLRWLERAPPAPAGLERDVFSWYLAQSRIFFQSPALGYPEALVVIERLCTRHELDLCDAPLGVPRLSISDFRALHAVNVAAASGSRTIWDQPVHASATVLEAIARSPTGHQLVHALPPGAPLPLERVRSHPEQPLGELLAPTIRDLHLRLARPETDQYSLADLREAHAVVRKVILDLLRLNPALLRHVGDLQPPTDTELITQWSLQYDEVAREWASRELLNCRRAIELLGVAGAQRLSE